MPVFVRAGSILPTGPIKQFALEPSAEPITLTIYPGADGHLSLYEDDGQTFAYEKGDFTRIELHWTDATRTLTLKPGRGRPASPRHFHVTLAGGTPRKILFSNKTQILHL